MRRLGLVVAVSLGIGVGVGSTALAADMPLPPAGNVPYIPVAPPPFNWTGFYVGGNLGLGWSQGNFSDPFGNTLGLPNNARLLGGGQAGFNFEYYGGFVIGAEADFDVFANSNTNTSNPAQLINAAGATGSTATIALNNNWLTTVTGRLGYAFDRVLLYGKGGGAWVGSNNPTVAINGAAVPISITNNNWGWTAGVGVEWTFWGNFSARVEYDYIGLNSPSFTIPASVGGLPAGDQFTGVNNRFIQLVNIGVNYRFGGWW
jgi:outer membrane immunogenic protein